MFQLKIMKVKSKNINRSFENYKCLIPVIGYRFKNKGYTHVQIKKNIYRAQVVPNEFGMIVWIDNKVVQKESINPLSYLLKSINKTKYYCF